MAQFKKDPGQIYYGSMSSVNNCHIFIFKSNCKILISENSRECLLPMYIYLSCGKIVFFKSYYPVVKLLFLPTTLTEMSLNNETLEYKANNKNLALPWLNSKPNVEKRCFKLNTSVSTKSSAKRNAYAGYVCPVASYATQAWFAIKPETKEIERVQ